MFTISAPKGRTVVYTITDLRTGAEHGSGKINPGDEADLSFGEFQQLSIRFDETTRDAEGSIEHTLDDKADKAADVEDEAKRKKND